MLVRPWRKGDPSALLLGMQTGAATVESSMEIPPKIKSGTAFSPSNPSSGNISKGTQNTNSKEHKYLMFIATLFIITKIGKQPKFPSVGEWIKQPWGIYTMEFYSAIKKKKILPLAIAWMDLENIMVSKISQSEKDKYHMISFI